MRLINGWVVSFVADQYATNKRLVGKCPSISRDFSFKGVQMIVENAFYIIKDSFFEDFPDSFLKGNKEENRPHYYCFKDIKTGLLWVIPLSSKVDKYKHIIECREKNNKPCDTLHILKLDNDRTSVFLIQDMFPITEKYIERAFTINGNPLRLTSEAEAIKINKKARKILELIKKDVKFMPTQPDVLKIQNELLNNPF